MEEEKECFKCNKQIIRKYVLAKKTFSLKNNWEYWTEKKENKDKYICNKCLLDLYYNNKAKYLDEVRNEKKRRIFSVYVYNKVIS